MPRTTKAERLAKARENAAFRAACNGVPIPVLELSAVFKTARAAVDRGATEAEEKRYRDEWNDQNSRQTIATCVTLARRGPSAPEGPFALDVNAEGVR